MGAGVGATMGVGLGDEMGAGVAAGVRGREQGRAPELPPQTFRPRASLDDYRRWGLGCPGCTGDTTCAL